MVIFKFIALVSALDNFFFSAQMSFVYAFACYSCSIYTGWPKKVSHYQVSSLNRIKNRH